MRRLRTYVIVAGGALAAVLLFLVLRPDDGEREPAATARAATGRTVTPRRTTTPRPTTTPRRAAARARRAVAVRVRVRRGRVLGGIRRTSVTRGRRVVLTVSADVRDEVHVHGYDLKRDVAPGAPARVAFGARLAGRFEIELERRGQLIAELEVRP